MEHEIEVKRNSSDPMGEVWISGGEAKGTSSTLLIYEDGTKGFFFQPNVAEQDYPLLMKKMLEAWHGDRPSSKTDENFTLGDA